MDNAPPLQGLRIIEAATVLAGPLAGQLCAHYGAEVIKVEPPSGDVTRQWHFPGEDSPPTLSAYFSSVNAGKKSIVLDLKSPADRTTFYRLLRTADVLLTNFTAPTAARLGLDPASLRDVHPGPIHLNITAYGETDHRPGYDTLLQADTGYMHLNGEPDAPPLKMPVALIDVLTGHHAFHSILLALWQRQTHQEPSYTYLTVTLESVAVISLINQAMNFLAGKGAYQPVRMGSRHPNIVPYGQPFRTADGQWVVLAVGNDAHYRRLCRILDDDALWRLGKTALLRRTHREAIYRRLDEHLRHRQARSFLDACRRAGLPATRVRTPAEVLSDPRLAPFLLEFASYPWQGLIPSPVQGLARATLTPPPPLNAHAKEILERLRPA